MVKLLLVTLFSISSAQASVHHAHVRIITPLAVSLRSDIATRKDASFETLLHRWQTRYGTQAVDPLFSLAADSANPDADRYVALMGAAKLGGYATSARVAHFLGDPAWMMRSGAIRLLTAFQDKPSSARILSLLRDKALVVRLEAVSAVAKLRPAGAANALVAAALDPNNYHGGKALWVPHRALDALAALDAREQAPKLAPLLTHENDPALQHRTVETLDRLAGHSTGGPAESLAKRVLAWKAELATDQVPTSAAHGGRRPIVTIE